MNFINKYRWMLPLLSFSIALILIRVTFTGRSMFIFLIWNLFLATVPLYFSYVTLTTQVRFKQWIFGLLWLLFFPNTVYIVTDLFHLKERMEIPIWYDLLILYTSALMGLVMGVLSLRNIEKLFARYSQRKRDQFIFVVSALCGYGIYLGRFERWNSWDIVFQPYYLVYNIVHDVLHPFVNIDVWMLSLCFGIWVYLLYKYLSKAKQLIRE